jgi:hypothetical protein
MGIAVFNNSQKVDYRPEIAPFNKNPTKAGGVFCFGGVGCSAPSPLLGCAHTTIENKILHLLFGIIS